jgi:hypothetical protein
VTAPPLPLPPDLRDRLNIILAKPALHKFPGVCEAVTALVQDAFARQPAGEAIAAMARQLAEMGSGGMACRYCGVPVSPAGPSGWASSSGVKSPFPDLRCPANPGGTAAGHEPWAGGRA